MSHFWYNLGKSVVIVLAFAVPAWLGAHTAVSDLSVGGVITLVLGTLETYFGVQPKASASKQA